MLQWIGSYFSGVPAQLVFFSVFLFGFIITAASMLFGHDGDADHGGDFHIGDHDIGHDADHGGDQDHHGPGLFSVRGISLLAIGFGGTGYIIQFYTGKLLVACVAGLGSAWLFATFGLWVIHFFYSQEGSSLISEEAFMGATGIVTTTIPRGGLGEVTLSVGGRQLARTARCQNGSRITQGTGVRVVQKTGEAVVVEEVKQSRKEG